METVKALEAPHQNLIVADALLRPTFQNLIDTESFHAVKLVVSQICVVNYFGQTERGSFTNTEKPNQRFESATVVLVSEFRIHHVVGQYSRLFHRCGSKDEFGFRIDEVAN